jgi:hypothetical protein
MEIASGWVVTLSCDVWPDQWIGRDAKFALPRRGGEILRLSGVLPGELVDGTGQVLEIRVDGRSVDRVRIVSSHFELLYELPPRRQTASASSDSPFVAHREVVQVEVRAGRHIVPTITTKDSLDRRRLSWRLEELSLITESDVVEPVSVGWFEDRWAGPDVTLTLPGTTGTVRLRGSVPDSHPALRGQELLISLNGGLATKITLGDLGEINEDLEISCDGKLSQIRLTATKSFTPAVETGSGDDRRCLSFLLNEVSCE